MINLNINSSFVYLQPKIFSMTEVSIMLLLKKSPQNERNYSCAKKPSLDENTLAKCSLDAKVSINQKSRVNSSILECHQTLLVFCLIMRMVYQDEASFETPSVKQRK